MGGGQQQQGGMNTVTSPSGYPGMMPGQHKRWMNQQQVSVQNMYLPDAKSFKTFIKHFVCNIDENIFLDKDGQMSQ